MQAPQAFNLFDPQLVAFGSSSTVNAKDVSSREPKYSLHNKSFYMDFVAFLRLVFLVVLWQGIIVITSKRGGSAAASSHCEWLPTVHDSPDAIHFQFIPIVSLLEGVPGKGFLSHAVNLYLRCTYTIFPHLHLVVLLLVLFCWCFLWRIWCDVCVFLFVQTSLL